MIVLGSTPTLPKVAAIRELLTKFASGTLFFVSTYGPTQARRSGTIDGKPYMAWSPSAFETDVIEPLRSIGIMTWVYQGKKDFSSATKKVADAIPGGGIESQVLGMSANLSRAATWLAANDSTVTPTTPGGKPASAIAPGTGELPWAPIALLGGVFLVSVLLVKRARSRKGDAYE